MAVSAVGCMRLGSQNVTDTWTPQESSAEAARRPGICSITHLTNCWLIPHNNIYYLPYVCLLSLFCILANIGSYYPTSLRANIHTIGTIFSWSPSVVTLDQDPGPAAEEREGGGSCPGRILGKAGGEVSIRQCTWDVSVTLLW